ncbi:hypothetical protein M885DRAFT_489544, partial [Pelagophyceae sp. CCMP2097]
MLAVAVLLSTASGLQPGAERKTLDRRAYLFGAAAVLAAPLATAFAAPAFADVVVDKSAIRQTKGGVKYVVVKEGACPVADPTGLAGSCYTKEGSFCVIDYTAFLPDGKIFDSTESKGRKPLAFKLGEKQVIVGLEQVVSQMQAGEEVQALIPMGLAYGAKGVCTDDGCLIPPNTELKYFVRLIRTAASAG